jgi:hypothetical protein
MTAWDAPNGTAFPDPIPQPPIGAIVARWGSDWVMAPWEDGQVWIRSAEIGLPDVANLEPPPAPPQPQVIYVTAQPAYTAPTAPAVQASEFMQPDPKAVCGVFIGCLPGQ